MSGRLSYVLFNMPRSDSGIAPGVNKGGSIAVYEATHGTAPKYAGQDKVNPGSLILSAEMMLRDMGWTEAADLVIDGIKGAIKNKTVTYDFERLMLFCSAALSLVKPLLNIWMLDKSGSYATG